MKYGLSEKEFSFLEKSVVSLLKNAGASVYVFGSRARGTHQKFSDVDILVLSSVDHSRLISQISEELEASNFPYKVDIVEERLLAQSYRASVHREKIAL